MFRWPEDHAGQRLDLEVEQAGFLLLGEVAHLRLREADVVEVLLRKLPETVADFRVGQPVVGAVPSVEPLRKLAHGRVAARGDVGQDALDRGADFRGVLRLRRLPRDGLP